MGETYWWSNSSKTVTHPWKCHSSRTADLGEAVARDDIAHDHAQETMGLVTDTGAACQGQAESSTDQFSGLTKHVRVDHVGDKILGPRGPDNGPLGVEGSEEQGADRERLFVDLGQDALADAFPDGGDSSWIRGRRLQAYVMLA